MAFGAGADVAPASEPLVVAVVVVTADEFAVVAPASELAPAFKLPLGVDVAVLSVLVGVVSLLLEVSPEPVPGISIGSFRRCHRPPPAKADRTSITSRLEAVALRRVCTPL